MLGQLSAQLSYARVSDILTGGLHEFVDDFQVRLNAVGEAIYETFFDIGGPERQSQEQRAILN